MLVIFFFFVSLYIFRLFTIHGLLTKFKNDSFVKKENKITLNFTNNGIYFYLA